VDFLEILKKDLKLKSKENNPVHLTTRNIFQNVFHDDLLPIFFTLKYLCYGDIEDCLLKYQASCINFHKPITIFF
jgi:hypothetical protein